MTAFLLPMAFLRWPSLDSQQDARFSGYKALRLHHTGGLTSCPAHLMERSRNTWSHSARRTAGHSCRGGLHSAFNTIGAHVVAMACFSYRAIPDHPFLVQWHARPHPGTGQQTGPGWKGEGLHRVTPQNSGTGTASQAPGRYQDHGPATDPVAECEFEGNTSII